jgi:hypothetical protein
MNMDHSHFFRRRPCHVTISHHPICCHVSHLIATYSSQSLSYAKPVNLRSVAVGSGWLGVRRPQGPWSTGNGQAAAQPGGLGGW